MFKLDHSKPDHSKVARWLSIAVVALAICGSSVAAAKVTRPGSSPPVKNPGLHHPVHGPGSSHNPIVRHPPLHGAGSSHNPIVVVPNASRHPAAPTLTRRCDPPPCPARAR